MKYLSLLLISLVFMASCMVEEPTVDFSGIYKGQFDCEGKLSEINGQALVVIITKDVAEAQYKINLGDDVIFQGMQDGEELIIAEQTHNEQFDFDVITLSGVIKMNADTSLNFEFRHEVDDEGKSSCNTTLLKQ